jgi:2-dehydropantoate 2-reductase
VKFLVFGAGAIGSLIGGSLATLHPVTLVGRRGHVQAIRRHGLVVRGHTEVRVHPEALEYAAEAEVPDVVILTVKSYDTRSAANALRRFRKEALFLSLQNGLGNVEILAERSSRVLGGVTYHGVTFLGPGEIEHAGSGDTILGPIKGASLGEAEGVAEAFRACGLPALATASIEAALWSKTVVNACFNPLTALLGARSGALGRNDWLSQCSPMIVGEAVAVAGVHGIKLAARDLLERVQAVSDATARNKSSMLQDVEKGHRTEIDAINGAIERMGAERGIDCPVNRLLTLLVKAFSEVRSSEWRA